MKRLHVNLAVEDLETSITFYRTLFGAEPSVRKPDYAKWLLDDPRVNFSLSPRGQKTGIDHLGIQVDSTEELGELAGRLKAAGQSVLEQPSARCCYAKSDKVWVRDPQGVPWETFHTSEQLSTFGEDRLSLPAEPPVKKAACCDSTAMVGG